MSATGQGNAWSREYPLRPIVGVAGVVLDGERVLLIRRGRAPGEGAWSLPGGALRVGELMAEGVAREVFEETGMRVRAVLQVGAVDRVVRDPDGRVQYHYVVLDWLCHVVGEETVPVAGGDAMEAAWVERVGLREMGGLDEVSVDMIERAIELAGSVV